MKTCKCSNICNLMVVMAVMRDETNHKLIINNNLFINKDNNINLFFLENLLDFERFEQVRELLKSLFEKKE